MSATAGNLPWNKLDQRAPQHVPVVRPLQPDINHFVIRSKKQLDAAMAEYKAMAALCPTGQTVQLTLTFQKLNHPGELMEKIRAMGVPIDSSISAASGLPSTLKAPYATTHGSDTCPGANIIWQTGPKESMNFETRSRKRVVEVRAKCPVLAKT